MPHRQKAKELQQLEELRDGFFVVDGGDGSGKDTVARGVREFLEDNGYRHRVLEIREPTGGMYGRVIRSVLDGPMKKPPAFQSFWFGNDREEHDKEIRHLRREGYLLVCIRYLYSSFAYGVAGGESFGDIQDANKNFLRPRFAFLLQVPPEVAMERIRNAARAQNCELFERIKFQEAVCEQYERMLQNRSLFPELVAINANRDVDNVVEEIGDILARHLKIPVHPAHYRLR